MATLLYLPPRAQHQVPFNWFYEHLRTGLICLFLFCAVLVVAYAVSAFIPWIDNRRAVEWQRLWALAVLMPLAHILFFLIFPHAAAKIKRAFWY